MSIQGASVSLIESFSTLVLLLYSSVGLLGLEYFKLVSPNIETKKKSGTQKVYFLAKKLEICQNFNNRNSVFSA